MFWTNYHSHSHFCDGTNPLEDYVLAAIDQQVNSYGFSSHAPVPYDCEWTIQPDKLAEYLAEADRLKAQYAGRIQLYKSMEIDYVPGVFGCKHPLIRESALDYTVGSVHMVDSFADERPWEIDGSHKVFLEGLEAVFNNDIRAAVSRYYELTREMIELEPPDIIGHLDKIKMQNYRSDQDPTLLFDPAESWYREEIRKTLDLLADTKIIVEVNTRGMYKKKTTEPYPGPVILEELRQRSIPVTISSDAHHPREITSRFSDTAVLLMAAGYREVQILHENCWTKAGLTPEGLQLHA